MRLDKLTIKSQEALSEAVAIATERGHPELAPLHVLRALVSQEQGAVSSILQRLGVAPGQVQAQTQQALAELPRVSGAAASPGMGRELQEALEES